MYQYQEPSLFSGTRGAVFLLVIFLHFVVGYAFYSGLARRIVQTVIPPVEIAQIEKPKDVDKPPPPPPKLEEIKPYVPPPEFVDVQAPIVETTAITVTTQAPPTPQAAPAPPAPVKSTPIRQDPKHPLKIGEDWYPDASKRANEEGKCFVQLKVAADGRIMEANIQQSSGYPRLDEACMKAVVGQRMLPATVEGKPVETVAVLPITWKLKNDR
jgi:protein TonB